MSDIKINFETAKLANDKLFNLETGDCDYMVDGKYAGEAGACTSCTTYIKRPTQTMLQKWLREVHNIDVEPYLILMIKNIEIEQDFDSKEYTYHLKNKGISQFVGNAGVKDSYEEALEVGLQEALKLLP